MGHLAVLSEVYCDDYDDNGELKFDYIATIGLYYILLYRGHCPSQQGGWGYTILIQ